MANIGKNIGSVKTEKMQAIKNLRRIGKLNKCLIYFAIAAIAAKMYLHVVWMEALRPSLRLICVAFIPNLWHLCSTSKFLFLLCNITIVTVATKLRLLSHSNESEKDDLYAEFLKRNQSAGTCKFYNVPQTFSLREEESTASDDDGEQMKFICNEKEEEGAAAPSEAKFNRSKSEKARCVEEETAQRPGGKLKAPNGKSQTGKPREKRVSSSLVVVDDDPPADANEESMIDEELNRRVENFILNFNQQIRLQRQHSWSSDY
eukprot:Gb_19533 [translate_table: standard]